MIWAAQSTWTPHIDAAWPIWHPKYLVGKETFSSSSLTATNSQLRPALAGWLVNVEPSWPVKVEQSRPTKGVGICCPFQPCYYTLDIALKFKLDSLCRWNSLKFFLDFNFTICRRSISCTEACAVVLTIKEEWGQVAEWFCSSAKLNYFQEGNPSICPCGGDLMLQHSYWDLLGHPANAKMQQGKILNRFSGRQFLEVMQNRKAGGRRRHKVWII